MGFNSSGVYTPPTGAENAAPSQIIRSATWNTIFTDISAALTTLGQASPAVAAPTTLTTAAAYTVSATDRVVIVTAAVGTITMPLGTSRTGSVSILGGATGYFGTHNVVLLPTSPDTLSGQASIVLNTDYRAITLYALPAGGYVVT